MEEKIRHYIAEELSVGNRGDFQGVHAFLRTCVDAELINLQQKKALLEFARDIYYRSICSDYIS